MTSSPTGRHGDDDRRRLRLLLVVGGGIVVLLTAAVGGVLLKEHVAFVINGDTGIERAAHRAVLASPALLTFARDASHAGDPLTRWIVAMLVVGYLAARRLWRLTTFAAVTFAAGLALASLLKLVVDRARPALPDPVAHAHGTSFPSGHAMGSTVLYGLIVVLAAPLLRPAGRWLAGAVAGVLVAAIATSRVLLGVHYTSDVVAGVVFGLAWLAICVGAFETWRQGVVRGPAEVAERGLEPAEQGRLR